MQYAYLVATLPALILWGVVYCDRKDLRKEMLAMSFLIGFLSVVTPITGGLLTGGGR